MWKVTWIYRIGRTSTRHSCSSSHWVEFTAFSIIYPPTYTQRQTVSANTCLSQGSKATGFISHRFWGFGSAPQVCQNWRGPAGESSCSCRLLLPWPCPCPRAITHASAPPGLTNFLQAHRSWILKVRGNIWQVYGQLSVPTVAGDALRESLSHFPKPSLEGSAILEPRLGSESFVSPKFAKNKGHAWWSCTGLGAAALSLPLGFSCWTCLRRLFFSRVCAWLWKGISCSSHGRHRAAHTERSCGRTRALLRDRLGGAGVGGFAVPAGGVSAARSIGRSPRATCPWWWQLRNFCVATYFRKASLPLHRVTWFRSIVKSPFEGRRPSERVTVLVACDGEKEHKSTCVLCLSIQDCPKLVHKWDTPLLQVFAI